MGSLSKTGSILLVCAVAAIATGCFETPRRRGSSERLRETPFPSASPSTIPSPGVSPSPPPSASPSPIVYDPARIGRLGPVQVVAGATMASDVGYDPGAAQYLVVGAGGRVAGSCANVSGARMGAELTFMDGIEAYGHSPRVEYSPDIDNGTARKGGFLVTWHQDNPQRGGANAVFSVTATCAGGPRILRARATLSEYDEGGSVWTAGAPIAYSRTAQRFLVIWTTWQRNIQGRFVDNAGNPVGPLMLMGGPSAEPGDNARDPGIAWNPTNGEFGLSYAGFNGAGAFARFARVNANGAVLGRTTLNTGPGFYYTDIATNTVTGRYVMAYTLASGTYTAELDAFGGIVGNRLVAPALAGADNVGIDFNPATRMFLLVGQEHDSYEIGGIVLNGGGAPVGAQFQVTTGGSSPGTYYPRVVGRPDAPTWNVSFSLRFREIGDQLVSAN
jgi:hypothetical protein